tara:strand:+ start:195 stop:449 length:255 start_codon:yes stop_codon:yes gene_type:complete
MNRRGNWPAKTSSKSSSKPHVQWIDRWTLAKSVFHGKREIMSSGKQKSLESKQDRISVATRGLDVCKLDVRWLESRKWDVPIIE